MKVPFTSRLSVSPNVLSREIGDEAVLLNLATEQYVGLDDVSNAFWQALTHGETVQAAYDSLLTEFDVDADQLRTDLEEFAQDLIRFGLVDQTPP